MGKNKVKGKIGEDLAAEFLENKGFKIIERNWNYSRSGEIDIIAYDKKTLVFVEVKTRSSTEYGYPAEAINTRKIKKMKTLAAIYLNEKNNLKFNSFRFDAIAVILAQNPEIKHYKDIYQF